MVDLIYDFSLSPIAKLNYSFSCAAVDIWEHYIARSSHVVFQVLEDEEGSVDEEEEINKEWKERNRNRSVKFKTFYLYWSVRFNESDAMY